MEYHKHKLIKEKYQKETGFDIYASENNITNQPTGTFNNSYVKWLEEQCYKNIQISRNKIIEAITASIDYQNNMVWGHDTDLGTVEDIIEKVTKILT